MIIVVTAKTNAKQTLVEKTNKNHFRISVTESPIEGKANKAIIAALAEHLGIAKSRISIKKGLTAKNKTIEII